MILYYGLSPNVTRPTHNRGNNLEPVNTKGLSIDISSIVDVALSDHHCVVCTTMLPIAQGNTERIIKKRYLTSEVATDFSECMKNTPPPTVHSERIQTTLLFLHFVTLQPYSKID